MNIYQKKIVKENDLFFFDDFAQKFNNFSKNKNPNIYLDIQPNLNIRNFYGISPKLLEKESEKNNRQFRSKSQIFTSSPIMDNLIPKEIKTIIIKLNNPKEQKHSEEISKKNINNKDFNFKTFDDKKFPNEKQNKNIINIRNNNFNTNFISFFVPVPEKKHTRNKTVIINNNYNNDNNNININTTIYKKSFCLDKPNKIKSNKERSTTAPKKQINPKKDQKYKINNKIAKNISTPNIHNIIDLCNIPKIEGKNKNKNQYINTNIYQEINISNNINNLNSNKHNISISPNKIDKSKISEILTGRNNKEGSQIKKLRSIDLSSKSKIEKIHSINIKDNYSISKFNDIIDKAIVICSTKNNNLYNNRYSKVNNRNQFLQSKARNKLLTIGDIEKEKNLIKKVFKNKGKLMNEINISESENVANKIKCIYTNNNMNNYNKKKLGHKNKEKNLGNSNVNNIIIQDENIEYDINIKDNNNSQKINQIKSIPLKLNNSCLFLSNPSK